MVGLFLLLLGRLGRFHRRLSLRLRLRLGRRRDWEKWLRRRGGRMMREWKKYETEGKRHRI